jgi:ABC-type Zn uptake system ZnuABC Zn-binding protein ZnuA
MTPVRKSLLALAALVALVAGGCGGREPAARDDGRRLRVVATTTQVQDFTRIVGGDRVQVAGILKRGVDAHDYEPSPADLDAIARADVLVENGVGLESWLDDTVRSAGFHGIVVDASRGVRLRQADGGPDPHIWQNPRNARLMAVNIERALAAADPAGARRFRANLDAYARQLDVLDAGIARRIDGLASKKLVTNHDAFGYYVERYGLDFVGSVIPSFDTSAELSARSVQDLVARIRAARVKAIFSESSLPPRTAETVGREAGVRVVEGPDALYGDSLGPPGSDADTYLGMMEHNTRTIVSALAGT